MPDELLRLRDDVSLHTLLAHYAELTAPDKQAWHPRWAEVEGCDGKRLSRLHGELIAFGWLEQNIGEVPNCYRATRDGLRATKQAAEVE